MDAWTFWRPPRALRGAARSRQGPYWQQGQYGHLWCYWSHWARARRCLRRNMEVETKSETRRFFQASWGWTRGSGWERSVQWSECESFRRSRFLFLFYSFFVSLAATPHNIPTLPITSINKKIAKMLVNTVAKTPDSEMLGHSACICICCSYPVSVCVCLSPIIWRLALK